VLSNLAYRTAGLYESFVGDDRVLGRQPILDKEAINQVQGTLVRVVYFVSPKKPLWWPDVVKHFCCAIDIAVINTVNHRFWWHRQTLLLFVLSQFLLRAGIHGMEQAKFLSALTLCVAPVRGHPHAGCCQTHCRRSLAWDGCRIHRVGSYKGFPPQYQYRLQVLQQSCCFMGQMIL